MSDSELGALDAERLGSADARQRRRNAWTGALFAAPALLFVVSFLLYPVAMNVWYSFTAWRKFEGLGEWAGLANYQRLATNPNFEAAAINTGIWVIASLVLPVALALALAVLLNGARFSDTAKTLFFLPRVLAPTAVGVIWYYVYAPNGVLNGFLSLFVGPVDRGWLFEESTITPAIIVAFVWQTVGLPMVLLLIGLAAIPRDPIEAAQIDGATPRQVFLHVTLPLLLPTLLVVVIISVLAGFTAFDHIWVMAQSFPGKRRLSLTVLMYYEAFTNNAWAFASAIAVVLGGIVLAVTWLQAVLQERVDRMLK
ncbi:MAG: sugar ABC transporter permease [Rhodobacter sp.]|jgi:ABC-type sugar transport system permease subunit|nr:sugar ABC transporter permease [Rhodobacter sp.]